MIDRKKVALQFEGLNYTILRSWVEDGHQIILVDYRNKSNPDIGWPELMCECYFDYEVVSTETSKTFKYKNPNYYRCPFKRIARQKLLKENQQIYGNTWRKMGRKEAIMDIFERVKNKEYLGQVDGAISLQKVAELLDVSPFYELLKETGELYGEERLQLNGSILAEFEKRFRFPNEINELLVHLIMDSGMELNASAVIYAMEKVLTDQGYKSGKDIFSDNWPNVKVNILVRFAERWLKLAEKAGAISILDDLDAEKEVLENDLNLANCRLDDLEEDARTLDEKIVELEEKNAWLGAKLQIAKRDKEKLREKILKACEE